MWWRRSILFWHWPTFFIPYLPTTRLLWLIYKHHICLILHSHSYEPCVCNIFSQFALSVNPVLPSRFRLVFTCSENSFPNSIFLSQVQLDDLLTPHKCKLRYNCIMTFITYYCTCFSTIAISILLRAIKKNISFLKIFTSTELYSCLQH